MAAGFCDSVWSNIGFGFSDSVQCNIDLVSPTVSHIILIHSEELLPAWVESFVTNMRYCDLQKELCLT